MYVCIYYIFLVVLWSVGSYLAAEIVIWISYLLLPIIRDGTSVILSDEVGQIFIVATGQGDSQRDAQYDQVCIIDQLTWSLSSVLYFLNDYFLFIFSLQQFFLGDYRPLMQDTNGNALDQVCFPLTMY